MPSGGKAAWPGHATPALTFRRSNLGTDLVTVNTPPQERTYPLGPDLVIGDCTAPSDDQAAGFHTTLSGQQARGVIDWRKPQAKFIQWAQEDEGLSLVEEEEDGDLTSNSRIMKRSATLQKVNVTSFHREQGNVTFFMLIFNTPTSAGGGEH
ncbi:hypothetical protein PGTUg99_026244 [Puccinia graminis f. sp. tritici]|uniref:Uncharacterized protein n=1 Tax=Puccinia graminis f. sp. tritici TaxID=56615 RepID=A0A5B0NWW1_PUCGR|nr:hypothetical protein PGTUg99_026244 [Puccinia graminis f. sp. tritici]